MTDIVEDVFDDDGALEFHDDGALEFQAMFVRDSMPNSDVELSINALFAEGWNIDSSIPLGSAAIIIFVRAVETKE